MRELIAIMSGCAREASKHVASHRISCRSDGGRLDRTCGRNSLRDGHLKPLSALSRVSAAQRCGVGEPRSVAWVPHSSWLENPSARLAEHRRFARLTASSRPTPRTRKQPAAPEEGCAGISVFSCWR
jgi:hypothetical protein